MLWVVLLRRSNEAIKKILKNSGDIANEEILNTELYSSKESRNFINNTKPGGLIKVMIKKNYKIKMGELYFEHNL